MDKVTSLRNILPHTIYLSFCKERVQMTLSVHTRRNRQRISKFYRTQRMRHVPNIFSIVSHSIIEMKLEQLPIYYYGCVNRVRLCCFVVWLIYFFRFLSLSYDHSHSAEILHNDYNDIPNPNTTHPKWAVVYVKFLLFCFCTRNSKPNPEHLQPVRERNKSLECVVPNELLKTIFHNSPIQKE